MKKIDLNALTWDRGSNYPKPFNEPCELQTYARIGRANGLTEFGVNMTRLFPGGWSSQRHWHTHEDEFVMVLEGEVVLVTDAGEEVMRAGDCAAFKAAIPDGHHFINRSAHDAVILEVGNADSARDRCDYPDIDMVAGPGQPYSHRDGTPYPDGYS
jgi:uncharacterized cupin superfamily protein